MRVRNIKTLAEALGGDGSLADHIDTRNEPDTEWVRSAADAPRCRSAVEHLRISCLASKMVQSVRLTQKQERS